MKEKTLTIRLPLNIIILKKFENGNLLLEDLFKIAKNSKNIEMISGKTEFLENIINNYI